MDELWQRIENNWVTVIFFVVGALEALVNSGLLDALFPEIGPALKSFIALLIPVILAPVARKQAFGKLTVRRERRERHGH